jgi:transketolase
VGDLVGVAVSGTLYHVPLKEFDRVRSLPVSAVARAQLFAALARINTLYMIARAGSGHIGSSFSSMDILAWLHLEELRGDPETSDDQPRDLFFSSKGHDAPGLYGTLTGLGRLDMDLLHRLRKLDGLPGHPDVGTPHMVTNTGSLGMGVSKAKGMIFANRLLGRQGNAFVMTGDGELQEGQFWESLISAANHGIEELTVIIDHNKLQSDTLVSKVSDLGDLPAKLAAFGWHVGRCDGNDIAAFAATLADAKAAKGQPSIIIADTVKGKGVSFMEATAIDSDVELYKFHSGAPTADAYVAAAQELIDGANALLASAGAKPIELETVERPAAAVPANPQRLIPAYSAALIAHAKKNPRIVALDADLILDTGLIPFQAEFPERFVECGIAEQDMVSQAGGMALRGLLPVVHSFACFLSSRPNEQIYNNATEHTKIVYVASLAGVVPAGPGHSHQAVRDISSLAGVPGLMMMEPSCEAEVALLLEWAVETNSASSYLRLCSLPVEPPYALPQGYAPVPGQGVVLREGADAILFAYGPIMLTVAFDAAERIVQETGRQVAIANLPWLNYVDTAWLSTIVGDRATVIALDNHYVVGGQGDRIADALATTGSAARLLRIGLEEVPRCGTNDEVLSAHALDAASLASRILATLKA